jgi:hypothetical protein
MMFIGGRRCRPLIEPSPLRTIPMATEAQILANRANAQKSTGPKSVPGKAASSRNSFKHGLAGSTTAAFMTEEERALVELRKSDWRKSFDIQGSDEEWLFEVAMVESIRYDRGSDAHMAHCRDHGRKARLQWDEDRRREADGLSLKLARVPQAVARQLAATPQGAGLMIDLWRGLAASLEKHRTWTDPQRSLALDLLGIHPELRDAETPVDPMGGDVLEARRAVVASEIARLESLRDGRLAERDADERAMAEATLGAELTKPLQLLHRYMTAAWNRYRLALRKLEQARRSREGVPAEKPRASSLLKATAAISRALSQLPPAPRPAPAPVPEVRPKAVTTVRVSATPVAPQSAPAIDRETADDAPIGETHRKLNRHQRRAQAALARQAR